MVMFPLVRVTVRPQQLRQLVPAIPTRIGGQLAYSCQDFVGLYMARDMGYAAQRFPLVQDVDLYLVQRQRDFLWVEFLEEGFELGLAEGEFPGIRPVHEDRAADVDWAG